jgi:hypothetical protein
MTGRNTCQFQAVEGNPCDMHMHQRTHSSLGYLTPAEFEEQWRKEQAQALEN